MLRAKGKMTNFSTSYLCKPKKLSEELCVTVGEAEAFIAAKAEAFPGLMPHVNKFNDLCQSRGYSETFLGVRRHLAKMFAMARTQGEIDRVKRLSWSHRIQSSGSEQVKLAMARCWVRGIVDLNQAFMAFQVHDEKVWLIRDDLLDVIVPRVEEAIIEQYADMLIEAETDPKVGKTFGNLKNFYVDKDK